MEDREKKAALEILLFTSPEPIGTKEIKDATGFAEEDIASLMAELVSDYRQRAGGIAVVEIADGWQMITNPEYKEWIRKLRGAAKAQKLSLPALETLAIIAYRQPLTKVEIDEIRGVNSDGVVKTLLEKGLIKIVGKKEAPGKPLLYGSTKEFLEYFGLKDLTELPTLKDLEREEAA